MRVGLPWLGDDANGVGNSMALDSGSRQGQLIYQIIIAGTAVIVATAGALWAISQTQLGALKELMFTELKGSEERDKIIREEQLDAAKRLAEELTRRENEIKLQIKVIEDELDRRRSEFVGQKEFATYRDGRARELETIREQLKVIEQTRPTTGELQATGQAQRDELRAISSALRDRIDKLYQMITSIEEYLRTQKR